MQATLYNLDYFIQFRLLIILNTTLLTILKISVYLTQEMPMVMTLYTICIKIREINSKLEN